MSDSNVEEIGEDEFFVEKILDKQIQPVSFQRREEHISKIMSKLRSNC